MFLSDHRSASPLLSSLNLNSKCLKQNIEWFLFDVLIGMLVLTTTSIVSSKREREDETFIVNLLVAQKKEENSGSYK